MTRQQRRAAARRKIKAGDMFVTHVGGIVMGDGTKTFFWCLTDSIAPPASFEGMELYGPYSTEDEAIAAADRGLRDFVGPQCEITEGGMMPFTLQ